MRQIFNTIILILQIISTWIKDEAENIGLENSSTILFCNKR